MNQANAAGVALFDRGRVLLIERAFEPFAGLWTLPGGRREAGETIEDTAIREIAEELGLTVHALRPVTKMFIGHGFELQVFATEAFEGEIVPSAEVAAHRWIEPRRLGALPTTPGLAGVLDMAIGLFERR